MFITIIIIALWIMAAIGTVIMWLLHDKDWSVAISYAIYAGLIAAAETYFLIVASK